MPRSKRTFPLPRLRSLLACLSILGLVCLSVMLGAAVMFFHLPTADFFRKAFAGARAWYERGRVEQTAATGTAGEAVRLDKPGKTWDGFTLLTSTRGSRAKLIDMRGRVVHHWELPFRKAFPDAPHVAKPLPEDQIHWFRCHLFPSGGLLAIYHAEGDTPYGYGLVKLDKDSRLLWSYAGNVHHDVDVGADGTIYTLGQKLALEPPRGLETLPSPLIAESVLVLSPEGKEREEIPILEAFRDSPYANLLLAALDFPSEKVRAPDDFKDTTVGANRIQVRRRPLTRPALLRGDVVHVNSVRVISPKLAPKFPLFRPGQLLISLRSPNVIAILDIPSRRIVWAARGVWQAQHDAEFLANGHLLIYDNLGSTNGTRVIEYDPVTQALPWVYSNENSTPHKAAMRGMEQRLPNGNTLIVNPESRSIVEVTPGKEPVWECTSDGILTGARRYAAAELKFLKGGIRARP
jgi:hypothetical protein